jgi:hypothetical protein
MAIETTPTIVARARGRPPEETITIFTFGKRCPGRRLPKAPNGGGNDNGGSDDGGHLGDDDPFGMHPMCCAACRHSISELYATVDECFQDLEAMRQHMEYLERVVKDDYKFLNRNVCKLFGMVGNMRGKWCNSCGR